VWTCIPETIADPTLLGAYEALESAGERERRGRLRLAKHRRERLVSVALVRTTLARYADVEPRAWIFDRGEHGRPDAVLGPGVPPLRFNLSHTLGMAVCAVTLDRDIGVDVESVERRCQARAIADRFFAPAEVEGLRDGPAERRRVRFFELWTLKEAYVKARGVGLKIPLRRFAFALDDARPIRVSFDAALGDDPDAWQFALFRPSPVHVAAVAVRRGGGKDLEVRVRRTVPLRD
jgi:4'-phosphopantetheinyl transferase